MTSEPNNAPMSATLKLLNRYACAHAGVNSLVTKVMWPEGVKIDQIGHGLMMMNDDYMKIDDKPTIYLSKMAEYLLDKETLPADAIKGYWLGRKDELYKAYSYPVGVTYAKHLLGRLGVVPMYMGKPFKNPYFATLHTYTSHIKWLGLEKAYQGFLADLLPPHVRQGVILIRPIRLDFAIDIPVDPKGFIWLGTGFGESEIYNKQTQTQYFGSRKSKSRLRIYNKKAQLAEKSKTTPLHIMQPHMMRVELTLKSGSMVSPEGNVMNIGNGPNRFLRIRPIPIGMLPSVIPELAHPHLLKTVCEIGLKPYLDRISPYKRKVYRKAMMDIQPPAWWTPEKYWAECLHLLTNQPFIDLIPTGGMNHAA